MVAPRVAARPAARHHPNTVAPPGLFDGAPFTKLHVAQVVVCYYLIWQLHFFLDDISDKEPTASIAEIMKRIVLRKVTFATTGHLVIGTSLLTVMSRRFERELGSVRFLWLSLFVNAAVCFVELLTVNLANPYGYVGPYPVLGACLWMYYRYTPRLYPNFVSVLGLVASEKVFYYLWFAQVLLSHDNGWKPATVGAFACALFFKLDLQMPPLASHQVSTWLRRFQRPSRVLLSVGMSGQPHTVAAQPAIARPPPRPVQADPAAVEQLVMMGFDQDQVVRALQRNENNVQRAADYLLSQVS